MLIVGSMTQSQVRHSLLLVFLLLVSTVGIHFSLAINPTLADGESTLSSSPNSMDVLMMGNSYTQGNNLESLTESLLTNDFANSNVDRLAAGGLNLADHSNRVQTSGHQWNTTLNNGNYDWVVLQDQSQIPSFPTTSQYWQDSLSGAVALNDVIEDNGAETLLLMTWGRRNGDQDNQWRNPDFLTMQANLDSGYRLFAENISTSNRPVWIVPAGLAFKHIYDEIVASGGTPENSGTLFSDLYSSDGSHPSLSGSYLTSLVVYATISGSNPVGLNGPSSLSSSRILELQEAAAATVFNNTQNLVYPWHRASSTTFSNGNSSVVLHPALNETAELTHRPGQRIDSASLNLTAGGLQEWSNTTNQMSTLAPNSTMIGTTVDTTQQLRLNTTGAGNVPNSGTNNTVISNSVTMSGNHSYDTLHLLCGIQTCGQISVSGGPLRIYANVIKIELGASIIADELVIGNWGVGGSTARATNGKSPGAGGGSHGTSGGAGGGTNGGSGGTTYGNGSEPGSSGGNVTYINSNGGVSNDANGGNGGGVVELYARVIYMNGSISANGGRGDDGAPPSGGTGPGGSGAGGGSGGSISLMANSIYIGPNGVISADGGDGGDGEDGVCAAGGPCLFMYDGGHGGGGGAGGIILLATTANNLNNNGATSVSPGSGGSGGAPYGTGTAGSAGYNGNAGYSFTGTFAGWTGSLAYIYSGNYTSPIMGRQGLINVHGVVRVPNSQPANTSIIATYRYSVDGSSWSQWDSFNLTFEELPPFSLIQFNFWLSTTNNTSTPRVNSIDLDLSNWYSIDDFRLSISNVTGGAPIWYFPQNLGVVRNITAIANPGSTTLRTFVPADATPIGSGWIHVIPPTFIVDSNVTFSVGGTTILSINSSQIPAMGLTVELNASLLQNNWKNNIFTSNGTAGIAWANLELDCTAQGPYMGGFSSSFAILPYELTETLGVNGSIVSALNDHVNRTSGRWAEATFSTFPVMAQGVTLDSHEIVLDELSLNFIDDILPEVSSISFFVDGQEVTEARVGDLVEIRVNVLGNESDVTIDWHLQGLGTISSWPPASLSTMSWDTLQNNYIAFYDTSQHSAEYGDSMALWLWMTDAGGNSRTPSGVGAWYEVLILRPVLPEFDLISVGGCERVIVAICETQPGDELVFQATAVQNRTDLNVFVHLINPIDTDDDFVIPLYWHDASKVYDGSTSLSNAELGWWDISFRIIDLNLNEENWSSAVIDKLHLIDSTPPNEGPLTVVSEDNSSISWKVSAQWLATSHDNSSASLDIIGPAGYQQTIPLTGSIISDPLNISSYVALGSEETMGTGASNSNNSTTGIIFYELNQTWPGLTLTNISDSWGSVTTFLSKQYDITAANPDIITIIPIRDYTSSSSSVWQSSYPTLLDNLASTGAQIYIGVMEIDPDYICHIGSGPAGCIQYGEFQTITEKNRIITEIAASRSWVTLVPLSDDGPEHPEWKDSNDFFTDAGHRALGDAMLHGINAEIDARYFTLEANYTLDLSPLSPGDYEFEMQVIDQFGNIANDGVTGPDATMTLLPDEDILSLVMQSSAPEVLHPGPFDISYDAICSIGCSMELEISLNGELIEVVQPTGGAGTYTVTIPTIGIHTISLVLSTSDWQVNSQTASLDVFATPPPAPEWRISCNNFDEELTLPSIAYNGKIGNFTSSTHFIKCTVTNSGDANGFVQISPNSSMQPFVCTPTVFEISPAGRAEYDCTAEESSETSGIFPISLEFEEVGLSANTSIGSWETTVVMLSPRFVADEIVDDNEPEEDGGSSTEVAGKTPFNWMVSAFVLMLVGIGAISVMFAMRDRKEPEMLEVNQDSLFNDNMGSRQAAAELESIHPSIAGLREESTELTSETTQPDLSPNNVISVDETGIIDSYLDLPGGGEYHVTDGITVYEHPDGSRWQQEDDGKFRLLE